MLATTQAAEEAQVGGLLHMQCKTKTSISEMISYTATLTKAAV